MIIRTLGIMTIILITLTGMCWGQSRSDARNEEYLRLHVIAHSDQARDQALKLKVRDAVLEHLQKDFEGINSAQEARQKAVQNKVRLETIASQVINEQGYDYPVQVLIEESDFPTRNYGALVLPQGRYQAVKIVIGQGQGKNWWCVLFPPLCLVSESEAGLTVDPQAKPEIRMKSVDWLKSRIQQN